MFSVEYSLWAKHYSELALVLPQLLQNHHEFVKVVSSESWHFLYLPFWEAYSSQSFMWKYLVSEFTSFTLTPFLISFPVINKTPAYHKNSQNLTVPPSETQLFEAKTPLRLLFGFPQEPPRNCQDSAIVTYLSSLKTACCDT